MIDKAALKTLNDDIYEKGGVDREHLLEFLKLVSTNDGATVSDEVKKWLKGLDDDPKYSKVNFPKGDIDAILSDLGSYGRVQPETLQELQQSSSRELPVK